MFDEIAEQILHEEDDVIINMTTTSTGFQLERHNDKMMIDKMLPFLPNEEESLDTKDGLMFENPPTALESLDKIDGMLLESLDTTDGKMFPQSHPSVLMDDDHDSIPDEANMQSESLFDFSQIVDFSISSSITNSKIKKVRRKEI
ncbi:hypothetical protein SUGI_0552370 [Cryptomeria japonica]|nr:hypothetical protein SUGI_0552370 [Cryptomeria japonica]